ncbi:hypothetical protein I3842_08G093800 [Carya illinoinensis]|uniref:Uncharacterized protein n=1 Tax=Carya illinoinensis TaxID=32201 RepID=A0A922EBD8_CARIL|nr:hypothetical protein I3842_08G093800 [Carya illinoinensis]KAG6700079.1 hypothetical protein I3842_08G093800 [Carya illinoinensis]
MLKPLSSYSNTHLILFKPTPNGLHSTKLKVDDTSLHPNPKLTAENRQLPLEGARAQQHPTHPNKLHFHWIGGYVRYRDPFVYLKSAHRCPNSYQANCWILRAFIFDIFCLILGIQTWENFLPYYLLFSVYHSQAFMAAFSSFSSILNHGPLNHQFAVEP